MLLTLIASCRAREATVMVLGTTQDARAISVVGKSA